LRWICGVAHRSRIEQLRSDFDHIATQSSPVHRVMVRFERWPDGGTPPIARDDRRIVQQSSRIVQQGSRIVQQSSRIVQQAGPLQHGQTGELFGHAGSGKPHVSALATRSACSRIEKGVAIARQRRAGV
jgi:hypothetical protein